MILPYFVPAAQTKADVASSPLAAPPPVFIGSYKLRIMLDAHRVREITCRGVHRSLRPILTSLKDASFCAPSFESETYLYKT